MRFGWDIKSVGSEIAMKVYIHALLIPLTILVIVSLSTFDAQATNNYTPQFNISIESVPSKNTDSQFYDLSDYTSSDLSNTVITLQPLNGNGDQRNVTANFLGSVFTLIGDRSDYHDVYIEDGYLKLSFLSYNTHVPLKLKIGSVQWFSGNNNLRSVSTVITNIPDCDDNYTVIDNEKCYSNKVITAIPHKSKYFYDLSDYSSADLSNSIITLQAVSRNGDLKNNITEQKITRTVGDRSDYKSLYVEDGHIQLLFDDYDATKPLNFIVYWHEMRDNGIAAYPRAHITNIPSQ